MDLESLTRTSGEWLKATGPDSDIVMSSRIRLARNLADFSFPSRADDRARAEIEELLRRQIAKNPGGRKLNYISVSSLDTIDRQMLVERQLISREHSETHGQRGVGISDEENVSVMINEEDHLRIQVLRSGFALDDCWLEIDAIDDAPSIASWSLLKLVCACSPTEPVFHSSTLSSMRWLSLSKSDRNQTRQLWQPLCCQSSNSISANKAWPVD